MRRDIGALISEPSLRWRQAVTWQKETKMSKLTITLTNSAPVSIDKDDWPILASAKHRPGSLRNGTPVPDYETDEYRLTVRQHQDGRTIVYGVVDASAGWTSTESRRGGILLDGGADIIRAISEVGAELGLTDRVIRECIADLPAIEL